MPEALTAEVSTTIDASPSKVWSALVDPAMIRQFMFGTEVMTDWKVGSPIVWKGTWEGKPYEDKGVILKVAPEKTLQYSHFSAMSGEADLPENYHTMTYSLTPSGSGTLVTLKQDGNKNEAEKAHSEGMWNPMLASIKKLVEESETN